MYTTSVLFQGSVVFTSHGLLKVAAKINHPNKEEKQEYAQSYFTATIIRTFLSYLINRDNGSSPIVPIGLPPQNLNLIIIYRRRMQKLSHKYPS
jgi:hypothetical protein